MMDMRVPKDETKAVGHRTGECVEHSTQSDSDPFALMFRKAVDALNTRYIAGTIEYIRKHHPELHKRITVLENRLNDLWKLESEAALEQFHKLLREWYLLHLQGIKLYSRERGKGGK